MAAPKERQGGCVNVLQNEGSIQAIVATHADGKKTLMAVFHENATLITPDGKELAGEGGKCLILPL
jgi:hypothetical protein